MAKTSATTPPLPVWRAMQAGTSGLLHAPTGTGKTLAANGLKEVEKISDISARLIVNQAALKTRPESLRPMMETFARAAGRS